MSDHQNTNWKTLDKDLKQISTLEYATAYVSRPFIAPSIALIFLVMAGLAAAILMV